MAVGSQQQCWKLTPEGMCGRPAVSFDVDSGLMLCEEHDSALNGPGRQGDVCAQVRSTLARVGNPLRASHKSVWNGTAWADTTELHEGWLAMPEGSHVVIYHCGGADDRVSQLAALEQYMRPLEAVGLSVVQDKPDLGPLPPRLIVEAKHVG